MNAFTNKSPTKFPIRFTDLTLLSVKDDSPVLLGVRPTEKEIYLLRNQYHDWRASLRVFGLMNEVSKIERDFRITTKINIIPGPPKPLYEIWIIIKPKLLGTLHLLNPELMAEIDRD